MIKRLFLRHPDPKPEQRSLARSWAAMIFLLMLFNTGAMAAKIESLTVQNNGGKTAIVFTFNGYVKHKEFVLSNPYRVVVDLEQTTTTVNLRNVLLGNGLISNVRGGHPDAHTLRLVFDARQKVTLRSMPWQPSNGNLQGLRVELVTNHVTLRSSAAMVAPVYKAPVYVSAPKLHVPPRSLRDVVVVIDPGHGGTDPGAIGMGRNAEKHVVLAMALKLKQLIDKQPGMRAVLTRNADYYVGLRERMDIARRANADIFVAIHADAFTNHNSNGASVFALSQRGATSEAARWLAEKENHSELGGVNLSGLDDQNGVIRTVLLDLSQTATIGASLQMGSRVLRGLDTITRLHNTKVEQARFMVLKSPDIPSILIETGFISNPREEKNLTSSAYQARMTQAIFKGIKGYFWDYPPHGTRVEAMVGGSMHLVRAGDTLPKIASQYHVSVAQLKSANGLSNMRVRSGQKLAIPPSWG